ncbi:MAG: DUF4159 domain-containing protein [Candidatus Marinimicrobia bacterium]|nr:DUF4159 domain-containing protein [Candidatus Neomarinimicrobiota bacterium]
MNATTLNRFNPSSMPVRLVIKYHRILLWAWLIALVLHIIPLITGIKLPEGKLEESEPPLNVKFYQRAPRLQKTMELMKKPKTTTRKFQQKIAQAKTFKPRSMQTAATKGMSALASLAPPSAPIERSMDFRPTEMDLKPIISSKPVQIEKESDMASLSENLLDASDLNIGNRMAYVDVNPNNKKDVKGFFTLNPIRYDSDQERDWDGNPGWNSEPEALNNLIHRMHTYTDIKMDIGPRITFDDKALLKAPMIFLFGETSFNMTDSEVRNLGKWLKNGGFLVIDNSSADPRSPFGRSAKMYVKRALGADAQFVVLPSSHPIYHCYFDFNMPPPGADQYTSLRSGIEMTPYLDGVFIEGRLAVLYSDKGYGVVWDHGTAWGTEGERGQILSGGAGVDVTRQYHMGINMIVFALTQPGGIVDQQRDYSAQ